MSIFNLTWGLYKSYGLQGSDPRETWRVISAGQHNAVNKISSQSKKIFFSPKKWARGSPLIPEIPVELHVKFNMGFYGRGIQFGGRDELSFSTISGKSL